MGGCRTEGEDRNCCARGTPTAAHSNLVIHQLLLLCLGLKTEDDERDSLVLGLRYANGHNQFTWHLFHVIKELYVDSAK